MAAEKRYFYKCIRGAYVTGPRRVVVRGATGVSIGAPRGHVARVPVHYYVPSSAATAEISAESNSAYIIYALVYVCAYVHVCVRMCVCMCVCTYARRRLF